MTPLADSGINDRLVKLCPLIDQTSFELKGLNALLSAIFGVKYLILQTYLIMRRPLSNYDANVSNLIGLLIITALHNNLEHMRLTR